MVEIRTRGQLSEWLLDKPATWGHAVLARAALRAFPYAVNVPKSGDPEHLFELALFRTNLLAWTTINFPQLGDRIYLVASLLDAGEELFTQALRRINTREVDAYRVASIAALAAFSAVESRASEVAKAVASDPLTRSGPEYDLIISSADWVAISRDCDWLLKEFDTEKAPRILSRRSLWLGRPPTSWNSAWQHARLTLFERDESFIVWIDWFERRIRGERSAFLIPNDRGRLEDKAILTMLADADDEEFWAKGTSYVNASLELWLDEARSRLIASSEEILPKVPSQDQSAIAYGVSQMGQIERLPASNQQNLRDQPNQRQIYADVRDAFDELRAEGQRLGETLASALERMLRSMPKAFEDAQAYLVWRDGNRLRRLYLAHRAVASTRDPDPARLEPAIAEQLGGALDLFNLFAMGDDGLRANDEATIPFQERASAETEAALARPVVAAMLDTPEIFTDNALGDLQATLDDDDLPKDDPYGAQTRVQTNKTWRNVTAAMFAAVRGVVIRGSQFVGKEMAKGALNTMGGAAFTDFAGATKIYEPLIEFISNNASALSAYAATAFSNYRLEVLIEAVRRFFKDG